MHPKAIELAKHYKELEKAMENLDPSSSKFVQTAKERAKLEPFLQKYEEIENLEKQIKDNKELISTESDPELKDMAREENIELEKNQHSAEKDILKMLLPKDEMKSKNIIVEIRAGAGGDEAALFAGDLFNMYTRYAETMRWKLELISSNEIGLGGYKEVVFSVSGKDVYGHLKFESGVHRVQRVPVTESGGRIHTSTASVAVLPEVDEVEVHIEEKELKIDVFRASGAGGQHVNKTSSAVRITHLPSGIVVSCQDERSQLQNKARAMGVLRSKLFDKKKEEQDNTEIEKRRTQIGSGDRAEKIRTYNYPENRVTDHRIKLTLYKLEQIMQGDLNPLIDALIESEQALLLKSLDD